MMFPKTRRWESKPYLDWIRTKRCIVCDSPGSTLRPIEAAHFHRTEKGKGRKPSDCFATPQCFTCHNEDWHGKGHFVGMTPEESKQLQEHWQRKLMAEWITQHAGVF